MNRRDLLKGAVIIAGASTVPASVGAETILNNSLSPHNVEISFCWENVLFKLTDGRIIEKKIRGLGLRHVVTGKVSSDTYNLTHPMISEIIYPKRLEEMRIEQLAEKKERENKLTDKAKELFDKEPHNHPRGHIPDWNRQPQFIKDVFLKKAKGY